MEDTQCSTKNGLLSLSSMFSTVPDTANFFDSMNSFQSEIRRGSGSMDLNPKSEQIKTFQGSSFFAAGDGAGEEPRDTPKD
jgi:hypothetical protein